MVAAHLTNDIHDGVCMDCGINCLHCHPVKGCLVCDQSEYRNLLISQKLISGREFSVCQQCKDILAVNQPIPCLKCEMKSGIPECIKQMPFFKDIHTQLGKPPCLYQSQTNYTCLWCSKTYQQISTTNFYHAKQGWCQLQTSKLTLISQKPCQQICNNGNLNPFQLEKTCIAYADGSTKCVKCQQGHVKFEQHCDKTMCPVELGVQVSYENDSYNQHKSCKMCFLKGCRQCYWIGKQANCVECEEGYLQHGRCIPYEPSNGRYEVYVVNQGKNGQDGSLKNPIDDFMRAFEYADNLNVGVKERTIHIYLSDEDHYIIPQAASLHVSEELKAVNDGYTNVVIKPLVCGTKVGSVVATTANSKCTSDPNKKVTIYNKAGDAFNFMIKLSLKIQNVIVDSIDSIAYQNRDPCAYQKKRCCKYVDKGRSIVPFIDGSKVKCETQFMNHACIGYTLRPTFRFKHRKIIEQQQALHIHNSEFKNFLTGTQKNFIQIYQNQGKVDIQKSKFVRFQHCSTLVSNTIPKFILLDPYQQTISYRINIRSFKMNENIEINRINYLKSPGVNNNIIFIYDNTFTQIPFNPVHRNIVLLSSRSSYGHIIDLIKFKMLIEYHFVFSYNKVTHNAIYLQKCDLTKNPINSIFNVFQGATIAQESLVRIENIQSNEYYLYFEHNEFKYNSGFSGSLINIKDTNDCKTILYNNLFIENSGVESPTVLSIGGALSKCRGVKLQQNIFNKNMGCVNSNLKAYMVYLSCNSNSSISKCTSVRNITICSPYTWMLNNQIIGNYYTGEVPLVRVEGVKQLEVEGDVYSGNVDHIFIEAVELYSQFKYTMAERQQGTSAFMPMFNMQGQLVKKSMIKSSAQITRFVGAKFTTQDKIPDKNSTSNIQIIPYNENSQMYQYSGSQLSYPRSSLIEIDEGSKLEIIDSIIDYQRGLTLKALKEYIPDIQDSNKHYFTQLGQANVGSRKLLAKGIYGPLIYISKFNQLLKSSSNIHIYNTTLLKYAKIAKLKPLDYQQPPELLFSALSSINTFLLKDSTISNIDDSDGWIRYLNFDKPIASQKIHIINTTFVSIGNHTSYPIITIRWESFYILQNNQIPEVKIDQCTFNQIKTLSTGAILVDNAGSSKSQSKSFWFVNILNCRFTKIESKHAVVKVGKGHHNFQITMQTCAFSQNIAAYTQPADLLIEENNDVHKLLLRDLKFLDQIHTYSPTKALSASIMSAPNSKSEVSILSLLFDCNYRQAAPAPDLVGSVVQLGGEFNQLSDVTIQNCVDVDGPLSISQLVNGSYMQKFTIQNIIAQKVGGISIKENSYVTISNLIIQNITSQDSGAIKLESRYLYISNSLFQHITCQYSAFITAESQTQVLLYNTTVQHNQANADYAIMILKYAQNENQITQSTFKNNTVLNSGNVINVISSRLTVSNTIFVDNIGGNVGFDVSKSYLILTKVDFITQQRLFNDQRVQNGYIYCKDYSKVVLTTVSMKVGKTFYATGVRVESQSNLTIKDSVFENLTSIGSSGALFLCQFGITTIINTNFTNCYKHSEPYIGSSILGELSGSLSMTGIIVKYRFQSQDARPIQAIHANKLQSVTMERVEISMVIEMNTSLPQVIMGGGIYFKQVQTVTLNLINISGMRNVNFGGGIAIEELDSERQGRQYRVDIRNVTIQGNNVRVCGGGMFLKDVQSVKVKNSKVICNKAQWNGGGVCYQSTQKIKRTVVDFDLNTVINGNSAQIGGGVYYDNHPIRLLSQISGNVASVYGADIGSYANRLEFMSESRYNQITDHKRELLLGQITNQQSGGFLPPIIVGVVDNLGNVISSDNSSKASLTYQSQQNSSTYGVNLKGEFQKIALNGFYVFRDIKINGDPGMTFEFTVTSDSIDTNKQNNKVESGKSLTQLPIRVSIRKCLAGEAYTAARECVACSNTQYLLQKYDAPQQCKECVREVMKCFGGNTIGPAPGYWRSSVQNDNMIQCLNLKACLGILNGNGNQLGTCASNYEGILCSYCSKGYSRNGQFECTICPHLILNIIRTMGLLIGGCVVVVILIRSTIQGAMNRKNVQSVYFKIMTNHVQLIGLIATFDFRWPANVLKLLDFFKVGSNISTQFLSFECLYNDMKHALGWNLEYYYLNLMIYSLTPIATIFICIVIWQLIRMCSSPLRQSKQTGSRTIASIIIIFFLLHPNLMNTMLDSFRCRDINGEQRLISLLSQTCYGGIRNLHFKMTIFLSLPTIVIWGLGIPILAFIILFRHRRNLNQSRVLSRYGFLFKGYKKRFYFWESVIMYRKIVIIFISVYLKSRGQITQAFVVALLLVVFIFLNQGLNPFILKQLNQMESLSILASMITVYCSFYYLSDQPEIYKSSNQALKIADNGLRLSEEVKQFFFCVILISNITFFLFWIIQIRSQITNLLRTKLPKIYLYLFLFGSENRLKNEIEQRKIKEQNDFLREEFEQILGRIQNMYEKEQIVLNQVNIEKLQAHLNPNAILQSINYKSPQSQASTDQTKSLKNFQRQLHNQQNSFLNLISQDTQNTLDHQPSFEYLPTTGDRSNENIITSQSLTSQQHSPSTPNLLKQIIQEDVHQSLPKDAKLDQNEIGQISKQGPVTEHRKARKLKMKLHRSRLEQQEEVKAIVSNNTQRKSRKRKKVHNQYIVRNIGADIGIEASTPTHDEDVGFEMSTDRDDKIKAYTHNQ